MSLVMVQWEDTTNVAAWQRRDEVEEWARDNSWVCENIGWLVHEDNDCVVLAARMTLDGEHVGLCERIPKRAILLRRELAYAPRAGTS